jgi:hypothetical protein
MCFFGGGVWYFMYFYIVLDPQQKNQLHGTGLGGGGVHS